MAFRFSLSAVLKYRKNLEQREYLALGRVQQEIAQVETQLSRCEDWLAEITSLRTAETVRGIASVHLQDAYQRERGLEIQRDELQARLEELKTKRLQCLKAYELARQKREILEELRAQQLDAYVSDQSRREQRQVDDTFLSRMKRHR